MKKLLLPNGLEVSNVALGAMDFGTTTSKEKAFAVLDAYLDLGGNFVDTSNNYAHWQGTGDESETLLGEYFASRKCRDRVVLATKVGFDRHGQGQGLKKEQIEYWIDESLRKLQTDYIDLYYAHTDDPTTPLEETMEAFHRLIEKGKVRHLGGSNYDTWRFAQANTLGKTPYTVMQQWFTYLQARGDKAPQYIFNEYTSRERCGIWKRRTFRWWPTPALQRAAMKIRSACLRSWLPESGWSSCEPCPRIKESAPVHWPLPGWSTFTAVRASQGSFPYSALPEWSIS